MADEPTPEPLDVDEGLPKEDEEKTEETEEVVVPGKDLIELQLTLYQPGSQLNSSKNREAGN